MRNPFRTRTTPQAASTTYQVGDVHYDRRSAELLGAFHQPTRWQSWAGAMRRMMSPGNSNGHEEQRAITSLPWVPFNQGNLIYPFGGSNAEDRALSLTPVYAAVQMIADDISTLPVKTYRKGNDQRIPMPSLPQLFAQLDDDGLLVDWLHRCMTSLLLRGNAYGLITARDGMQFPTAVMWLDPSQVTCNESNPAAPIWYWLGRHIPAEDLIHIPWFTVAGKVLGLSPIEAFALTMNVGLQAQDYTAGWFSAGGVPPGTFKNNAKTVNSDEAEIIKDRLVNAIRSRKPIVYGSDWDYNPITIPPEQAQFVQTMKLTATQVASIYRIPAEMIGGETGGSLTYNSPEQNMTYYVSHTLRPWLVRLESKFSSVLPLKQYVKLNADALIRADQTTRYSSYQIAAQIGLLTLDEMRALEDRPPLPPDESTLPPELQPAGAIPVRAYVVDTVWDQPAIGPGPKDRTVPQELLRRRYEPDELGIEDDELDEETLVLLYVLAEFDVGVRAWDPAKHPRNPAGSPGGGKFRTLADRIGDALQTHLKGGGSGDPFDGFDREQLRKTAKARGIALKRGASRDDIAKALVDDLHKGGVEKPKAATTVEKVVKKAPAKVSKPSVRQSHGHYTGPRYEQPSNVDRKAEVDLRAKFHVDFPELWSQGHVSRQLDSPDPEMRRLIAKVGPTVATRLAWEADNEATLARMVQLNRPPDPNLSPYDDLPPVTTTELDKLKTEAAAQLREDFADKKVAIRVTGKSLDQILADGRFKTQFETKTSGGGYVPTKRAAAESMMFGLPADADPTIRPVYGYLAIDGIGPTRKQGDLLNTYGDVQVVLKDSVRSRTTASVGDSLDHQILPSPVDDPSWESFNGSAHQSLGMKADYTQQRSILYVEAQIHNGVGVSDIEEVIFPAEPSAGTQKSLTAAGITWRVLQP